MTSKQKETRLNAYYADILSESQAVDHFIYLTNKARGHYTTLGTLLRKYEPDSL